LDRDQKFFDMYSLVIGVLAIAALGIFILAMKISDRTQEAFKREGAEYQATIASRIRPFGEVYMPGEEGAAAAPTATTVAEPEPVAAALSGPQVYNNACLACHGAGIGGAPVPGDADAWIGDRALGMWVYEVVRAGKLMDILTPEELQRFSDEGILADLPERVRQTVNEDELYYLETMRKIIAGCDQPFYTRVELFGAIKEELHAVIAPHVAVVSPLVVAVAQRPQVRDRRLFRQETGGGVLQHHLFFIQYQCHDSLLPTRPAGRARAWR